MAVVHLTERIKRQLRIIWNLVQLIVGIPLVLFLAYVAYLNHGIWPFLLFIAFVLAVFYREKIPILNHFLTDDDDDDSDSGFYDLDVECELSTSEDRKPQRLHDENNPK